MNIHLGLIALILTAGAARADVSSWTGRASPEIFSTFKYPYQVGAEIEVSRRLLTRLVDDLDLSQIERGQFKVDLSKYTENYLNRASLARLTERDPALAAELTRGLTLDQNVADRLAANAAAARDQVLGQFRASLAPGPSLVPKVGLLGRPGGDALHQQVLERTDPTRAKLLARFDAGGASLVPKVGLPGFKAFGFGETPILIDKPKLLGADGTSPLVAAETVPSFESGWRRLHERWDELDPAVKVSAMRFAELSADKKADVVVRLTRHQKQPGAVHASELLDVTTHGAPYLRPFVAERDGAHYRRVGERVEYFYDDPDGQNAEEFKHREPVDSARTYLDQLAAFTKAVGNFHWIRDPQAVSRRDSTYHWNFSVEGRRESLGPLLRAWQNLVLLKQLSVGITNVFGTYGFSSRADDKGLVRLKGRDLVEVRDHFADPEFELALFMSAAQVRNREGIALIYDHLPAITPAMLRVIRAYVEVKKVKDEPDEVIPVGDHVFMHLMFGSPGLAVPVTLDMFPEKSALAEAKAFYRYSVRDPLVLHDPRRVIAYLGPEGTAELRRLIAWGVLSALDQNPLVTRAQRRFNRIAREEAWLAKGNAWITASVHRVRGVRASIEGRFTRAQEHLNLICEDLLLSAALRRHGR